MEKYLSLKPRALFMKKLKHVFWLSIHMNLQL